MRKALALTLALFAPSVAATNAAAAPVTQLIAEKAASETGAAMPPAGRYDVALTPGDMAQAKIVSAFAIDRSTGQFAANVVTDAGETWRVTGLATLTVPVPVPVRRIMPEELLTRADFVMVNLPYQQLGSFAVTSLDRLNGMQVRRVLSAGRPVMAQSVTAPIVVGKGDKVSLEYHKGNMQLTAPGRAITSAEAEQEVRVINLVSNRTVTGVAKAAGIVEVSR